MRPSSFFAIRLRYLARNRERWNPCDVYGNWEASCCLMIRISDKQGKPFGTQNRSLKQIHALPALTIRGHFSLSFLALVLEKIFAATLKWPGTPESGPTSVRISRPSKRHFSLPTANVSRRAVNVSASPGRVFRLSRRLYHPLDWSASA